MKVDLEHSKQAIDWLFANIKELKIDVEVKDRKFTIKTFDRNDAEVTITISEDGMMLPKITKTEVLK